MKTFLVVNPRSGNGATGRRFAEIGAAVRAVVGEFGHAFTERPMHACELARQAVAQGYGCVVAVGGDGTVNEVVNGLVAGEGASARTTAALGILPRGTGGDFRKTFGWGKELAESAGRLAGEAVRAVDLGHISFVDREGKERSRYFANIASAGVSGLVDHEVNRTSKALGGKVSFAVGTLRALLRWRDAPVRARFDDGAEEAFPATVVAVANGQYFGGGMWVAPGARPDDGLFDVTIWRGFGALDFALKGRSLYDGSHVRHPQTRCLRARKVRLETDREVLLDVDGEQPGRLPATFEILPGALQLKVAPGA